MMRNQKKECLYSFNELRSEFEKLSRVQNNLSRTEQSDYDCLVNIKNILQKISVQGSSLLFPYYFMNRKIKGSLARIKRMNINDQNPHYHPMQTGVCILLDWGKTERINPEFGQLENIERFLQRSFLLRFMWWVIYFPVRLKLIFFK